MQRIIIILAYLFFPIAIGSVNCFSQPAVSKGPGDPVAFESREQYPFVQYTPKDGLISNSIRGIYQDSKGRLYFNSINGLSVYDGARFTNYTSKNGLHNDIVNCVMEMGNDSVWIVTNAGRIHCLVNGKLKSVVFKEPPPLIDNLIRDEKGGLYAASEFGLFLFRQNKFIKLPLTDVSGKNINSHISNIYPAGKHLLVVRENSLLNPDEKHIMYLYDVEAGKIVAQTQSGIVYSVAKAPDGRIWLSTIKNILSVDTIELKKGKIVLRELQPPFDSIEKTSIAFISFDQYGNCWISDKVFVLKKLSPNGSFISFSTASGLSSMDISNVFQDKEGTTWIATFKAGVNKLVHSNFTFFSNAFGISSINSIVYATDKNQLYLYSPNEGKAIAIGKDNHIQHFEVDSSNKFLQLHVTPKGMFGFTENNFFKISRSGNKLYSKPFYVDTIENPPGNPLVDRNGNLVFWGKNFITAIIDGKTIYLKKNNYAVDHASLDTIGNIWIATRNAELIMYQPQANDPSNYLEKEIIVSKKIFDNSPRSIIIDRNNNIWIGSRGDGIHVFKLINGNPIRQFHLTTEMGLSDHFITWLDVDMDNNIWACSPSGLDKISIKNGVPVIENITKQNNIYQSATKVVIDKNNTVWALLSNGLIKITLENKQFTGFSPTLMVSMIKSGKDTITGKAANSLTHKQNNLNFYFAATSFLDEKQIQYSYMLQGSGNDQWSDPSNNSTISFIDLHPGDYILNVKANFPAGRYPDQVIQNKFSILPPWWQTWWLRSLAGLLVIGLLIIGTRYYYRRKMEKQKTILEKQQAIAKERTRIATDMHDDLGAGLSRIKFLSETIGIKQQQQQTVEEEISSIRNYSHEMIDKMGEIVWALNEKNDTLSDLLAYTRSYAVEYLSQNGIKCIIETPEQFPQTFVSGEFRRNIYLTVKEALHNIVKHAQASEVTMKISLDKNLNIRIKDDGTGFDRSAIRPFSNGLSNMESRIKEAGGRFEIISDAGTDIRIKVPLPA